MGSGTSLIQERRAGGERSTMLSRVADSLYWMSRYLERAENTVRLLDVTMSLMLDSGGANAETRWQRMVAALGRKPRGSSGTARSSQCPASSSSISVDPSSVTYCISARARKRPPGARRNLHRAVAAPQSSLPPDSLAQRGGAVPLQRQRNAGLGRRRHLSLQRHH